MTAFRSQETLAGLIALGVVPWIVLTIRRGLRDQALPIGRGYVNRDERPGGFRTLLAFYALAALFLAFIGLDLLRIWS